MSNSIRILGIAGSLRKDSYNKATSQGRGQVFTEGSEIEIFELDGGIPGFNQDDEQDPPAKIARTEAKGA